MKNFVLSNFKMYDGDVCLADSATTHTVFRDKKYFSNLKLDNNVNIISSSANLIEGYERANIV